VGLCANRFWLGYSSELKYDQNRLRTDEVTAEINLIQSFDSWYILTQLCFLSVQCFWLYHVLVSLVYLLQPTFYSRLGAFWQMQEVNSVQIITDDVPALYGVHHWYSIGVSWACNILSCIMIDGMVLWILSTVFMMTVIVAVNLAILYIGWQWCNFFISYLCQLFFRHVVGQALQNISYSGITFFVR